MTRPSRKTVFLVADDMFFSSKIENTAKNVGFDLVKVKKLREFPDRVREKKPDLVIIDLASRKIDTGEIFNLIKGSSECAGTFCVGYLPHVEQELARRFREMGVDLVVPRSRFSAEMAEIIGKRLKVL